MSHPVYVDLTADQANAVARGAKSFGVGVWPNIAPGSELWFREPWELVSDSMGEGLATCCYLYEAEYLFGADKWVKRDWAWSTWKPAATMPASAIRLRRRCVSIEQRRSLVFSEMTIEQWVVGIEPLAGEQGGRAGGVQGGGVSFA